MTSVAITPLTEHTGAEVTGIDFSRPVDADDRATLNKAFSEHHVLVMRDQHFDPEQFKVAVQLFGELNVESRQTTPQEFGAYVESQMQLSSRIVKRREYQAGLNGGSGMALGRSVMPGLVPGIHVLNAERDERRGWPGQAPP